MNRSCARPSRRATRSCRRRGPSRARPMCPPARSGQPRPPCRQWRLSLSAALYRSASRLSGPGVGRTQGCSRNTPKGARVPSAATASAACTTKPCRPPGSRVSPARGPSPANTMSVVSWTTQTSPAAAHRPSSPPCAVRAAAPPTRADSAESDRALPPPRHHRTGPETPIRMRRQPLDQPIAARIQAPIAQLASRQLRGHRFALPDDRRTHPRPLVVEFLVLRHPQGKSIHPDV